MSLVIRTLLAGLLGLMTAETALAAPLTVARLRCEYRENPLGIGETVPRLSWQVRSNENGQRQTAYQILVASSKRSINSDSGDLWDSGKVESDETIQVRYDGRPLASRQVCYWKVRAWDRHGKPSAWSDVASWSVGLLNESDWSADYISYRDETPVFTRTDELFLPAARYYRREFAAERKIRRATVYATALGIYELHINGQRVSDEYFAPGWTDYRQRAYYNTYDVTSLVEAGENAIGATVADGWYSGYVGFGLLVGIGTEKVGRYTYGKTPAIRAQLEIEYTDGTRETIATDPSWKVTDDGPIQEADLLMGERYDARKEMNGWATTDFDDSGWEHAILAEQNGPQPATFYEFQNPTGQGGVRKQGREIDLAFRPPRLEAFPGEPVRVIEEIRPVEIIKRDEGTYIFNLGQNFAGTVRFRVQGEAGREITLRYGEMLHPDGRLMTENLRRARATDTYICKGSGIEEFQPRFTFHGFQYVEVSNLPEAPTDDTIAGLVLHSDTELTSEFRCSDPMVNQLFKNVVWTQRANFLDLPTDCPQRDERMGWTGDAQVYVGTAVLNADVSAFFTKWTRELMESQRPSGAFPGYAPFPFQHGWDFGSAWSDAGIICPWTIWQTYGDTRLIERHWEPMTRFMEWRQRTSRNNLGVVHGNAWGDWLSQGAKTPLDFIDTIYYGITSSMMADMAAAIGKDDEATRYREQFKAIKQAFADKYVQPDGRLKVKTQTAYALALFANLIPNELREQTGARLAELIALNGNHMATGFLGTRPLLPVLSDTGQHDLATFLLQSHEFPSWGYEIDQGATSIWERWDSYTKEDGFGRHNAAMNSFSHYSFGAVCEWMFRTLAGIDSLEPGYGRIRIQPRPPAPGSNANHQPIDWLEASYDSIRGRITSAWRVNGRNFELNVTIPANTTALVTLPANGASRVSVDGHRIEQSPLVQLIEANAETVTVEIQSGHYRFLSRDAIQPASKKLETSEPADMSINPDEIDLNGAYPLASWDFTNADALQQWTLHNGVTIEAGENVGILRSSQGDPQMIVTLVKPIQGPLAIELKAKPERGAEPQFFWAGPQAGFSALRQTKRQLNSSESVNSYLFRIGDGGPVQKLRFDPLANQGEIEIESITIYQLVN